MKEVVLSVTSREGGGKNYSRKLRREGRVPAALYGPEIDAKSISIDLKDLQKIMRDHHGSNVLFSLDIDAKGVTADRALIRSIQRDPVLGDFLHIDLLQISMTKPIHLTIPVNLNGLPEGVKTHGGVLQQIIRELEVSCLPTQIPDSVEIDVTELGIHESIHVSEITVENATVLTDTKRTIVIVSPPTVSTLDDEDAEETEEGAEGVEGDAEGAAEGDGEAKPEGDGDSKK